MGESARVRSRIASNLDTAESDLATLDTQELTAALAGGAGANSAAAADAAVMTPEDQERRQNFWWYLLMAGIVLLGAGNRDLESHEGPDRGHDAYADGGAMKGVGCRGKRHPTAFAPMPINDAHCHFFSEQFFATLGRQRPPERRRLRPKS